MVNDKTFPVQIVIENRLRKTNYNRFNILQFIGTHNTNYIILYPDKFIHFNTGYFVINRIHFVIELYNYTVLKFYRLVSLNM